MKKLFGSLFPSYQDALVRSCYRVILGREPEAEILAEQKAMVLSPGQEQAIHSILEGFLSSAEYRAIAERQPGGFDGRLLPVASLIEGSRADVEARVRRHCMVTYLGDRTALCWVLGRFMMFVHTTDVGFAPHVMQRGIWEMPLTEFMVRTVKPGMRALDIGANMGYYALLMAELVGHEGHCTAFEPNPALTKLLRQSLAVNGFAGRSSVHEIALSDGERDAMRLFVPHHEPKNAHLIQYEPEGLRDRGDVIDVPVRALDQMAAEIGRVDFVKMDAEGAEMDILRGMASLIRSHKPRMIVEVNARRGNPADALHGLLAIYGEMRALEGDGMVHPVTVDRVLSDRSGEDFLLYFE